MRVGAFILAAGFSSRMGSFKPLLALGGKSLLARCVASFRTAGVSEITVISGHRHAEIFAACAALEVACVWNKDYAQGMFSSVICAARAAAELDAFFVLPVDIPLVRPVSLTALLAAFAGQALVPTFSGQAGHPPLLPASLAPRILEASGAGGLRGLLAEAGFQEVPVWDAGILRDADTPEDFAGLARREKTLAMGTYPEIRALAELSMPARGVAHGLAVAEVAVCLGNALVAAGCSLNLEIVRHAALLHDIAKGEAQHEERGGQLLRALGLEALAPAVAAHRDVLPRQDARLTEEALVCLADKLVRGTQLVPVTARFAEKLALYHEDHVACAAIRGRREHALALQQQVEEKTGKSLAHLLDALADFFTAQRSFCDDVSKSANLSSASR